MEIAQIEGIGAETKAIDEGAPLWDKQQLELALILRCQWDGAVGKGLVSKLLLPFLCERHEKDNLFDDMHLRNTLVETTLDHWHTAKHRNQWHEKHYTGCKYRRRMNPNTDIRYSAASLVAPRHQHQTTDWTK
jgi:hypothetical protein